MVNSSAEESLSHQVVEMSQQTGESQDQVIFLTVALPVSTHGPPGPPVESHSLPLTGRHINQLHFSLLILLMCEIQTQSDWQLRCAV